MPRLSAGRTLAALAGLLLLILVVDLRRPPADQFTTRAAVGSIHLYQATLSRVYSRMGIQCRFTPTCSHYGEVCITRFGVMRGGWMAAKRVLRCGPWTPAGTVDPPPLPQASREGTKHTKDRRIVFGI